MLGTTWAVFLVVFIVGGMTGWDIHTGWLESKTFTFGKFLQEYSGFLQFIAALFLYAITSRYVGITEQQLTELKNQYSRDRSPALLYANYKSGPRLVNMSPYLVHVSYIAVRSPKVYKVSSAVDWLPEFREIPAQSTVSFPEFYNHLPEGNSDILIVFKHGGTGLTEHTLIVPVVRGPTSAPKPRKSSDGIHRLTITTVVKVEEDKQRIHENYEPRWENAEFFDIFEDSQSR